MRYKIIFITYIIFTSTVVFAGPDDDIYTRINRDMDVFGRVYKEIMLNYVDEINGEKFIKAGIEGMLATLDPYTIFLDESRKDEVDLIRTGKYGGIGITVTAKDSFIVISDLMEGYSAQKEGLRRGDKIIMIDGMSVVGKKLGEVRALTRGAPGSKINITIRRGEREIEFTLIREEIQLKNVGYKDMLDGGIAYIKLDRFNKYAESEMTEALNEMKSRGGLNGVILDLRDNPGGLVDAAIGVLDKFIQRGSLLVTTKGRKHDSETKYFASGNPIITSDLPVVVLINGNTVSASELVAGAFQDLDRGVIVGTKSFGKGLVQIYQTLSYGNQLRLTSQKYFTPSGRWIQSKNYFKENKHGVFKADPYFSQKEFKTLNGRTVYAEGGITPDKIVDVVKNNELLEALNSEDMYYKFAKQYTESNPSPDNFSVTEELLQKFYDFISNTEFEFETNAEKLLEKLKKDVENNKYSENILESVQQLKDDISREKFKDFEKSKNEIGLLLGIEIIKLYRLPGKKITELKLERDLQLKEAMEIIKDREYYMSFLKP